MQFYYHGPGYDWLDDNSTRTPEEYPYSHSEYYLWRDFHGPAPSSVSAYYTDRMRQWDGDKYRRATDGKMRNFHSVPINRQAAQEIVRDYFGADFECVGVAQSMNVSSGYPLGIIFVRKRE